LQVRLKLLFYKNSCARNNYQKKAKIVERLKTYISDVQSFPTKRVIHTQKILLEFQDGGVCFYLVGFYAVVNASSDFRRYMLI
jgi:hypothetical protein